MINIDTSLVNNFSRTSSAKKGKEKNMSIKHTKKLISIILIIAMIASCVRVFATSLVNDPDTEYMELKVVSISDVDGADKQVTLEWWSYNLKFKGLDLRFSYDDTKLEPSNISTNAFTSTATEKTSPTSFQFEGDFASYMSYMVLSAQDGEYRCVMDLEEYDDSGTYIENDSDLGYVVNTNQSGGVLIGKMSFRLFDGEVDSTTFSLKSGDKSPLTGIKIDQTYTDNYTDESVFRFSVLSSDSSLNEIKYNFFNYDKDDDDEDVLPSMTDSDYTELDLSQKDSDSTDTMSKYTIVLNEYLDNISLKLKQSDTKSTVKINGTAVDISKSQELPLNSLGGGDTTIDILLTAQDGTEHTYRLIIQRPFATIKGEVYTAPTQGTTGNNNATVRIYQSSDTAAGVDWSSVNTTGDTLHDELIALDSIDKDTEDDGTYEVYVIPGTYDVLLDKEGYLDHIFVSQTLAVNDVLDLGKKDLIAGDVNKDGVIQTLDLSLFLSKYNVKKGDSDYSLSVDFNEDESVQTLDLSIFLANYKAVRTIE